MNDKYYAPQSGKTIKSNGEIVNIADLLEQIANNGGGGGGGSGNVTITADNAGLAKDVTLAQVSSRLQSLETLISNLISTLQSGQGIAAVTPDDDNDLPSGVTRALMVGTAGNAMVTMANDSIGVVPLTAGFNQLSVKRVHATDTTATDIVAVY